MIYSYVVSSLSNYIQDQDHKTLLYHQNLEKLNYLSMKFNINKCLYNKIKRYLNFEYKVNKIDNKMLLNDLPGTVRNEMMNHMYIDFINSFTFFKNF